MSTAIILAGTLLAMLLATRQQRGVSMGMYRSFYLLGGTAALGIAAVPNPWLQAVLMLLLVNLMRDSYVGVHLTRALPLYLMVCAGVLVFHQIDHAAIFWGLVLIVAAGVVLLAQVLWNLWTMRHYQNIVLHAWQENVNNTQAISVVCTSAAVGLTWAFSPWWGVAVVLTAFPIALIQYVDWRWSRSVTVGPVILAGLGVGLLPFVLNWWTLVLVLPVGVGLVWSVGQAMRHHTWWDSGRIRAWWIMLLTGWWLGQHDSRPRWDVRLFGKGWQSWIGHYDFMVDVANRTNRQAIINTKTALSTAHNEFVHMLFEHGAVGFVLLVGYVLTTLWRLAHGSLEAQAVYLVGLGVCGVACALHPWTWTHGTITEVNTVTEQPEIGGGATKMFTIGSPALLWLSFLVAILAEVAR